MDMYHTGGRCVLTTRYGVSQMPSRMGNKDDRRGHTNRPSGRSRGREMCRLSKKKHKMAPSPQSFDRSIITNDRSSEPSSLHAVRLRRVVVLGCVRAIQKPEITLFPPTRRLHQSAHSSQPVATNHSSPVPTGFRNQQDSHLPVLLVLYYFTRRWSARRPRNVRDMVRVGWPIFGST
jgi:hypothetical protein